MNMPDLVDAINNNFRPPFTDIPVKARLTEEGDFCLKIGPRDIQIADDGKLVGSGTVMRDSGNVENGAMP